MGKTRPGLRRNLKKLFLNRKIATNPVRAGCNTPQSPPVQQVCKITHKSVDTVPGVCVFLHIMNSRRSAAHTDPFTRRERQIMDVVYAAGRATAKEIEERMPDAPTYATVRTLLRVLVEKGYLKHRQEGRAFVYEAVKPAASSAGGALRRLVEVFFSGSPARVVSSLLDDGGKPPAPEELDRMEQLIQAARKRQKK